MRPAAALAGLIEIRGLGIRRCAYRAVRPSIGLVVDLRPRTPNRLPTRKRCRMRISNGIDCRDFRSGVGYAPLPLVIAALTTSRESSSARRAARLPAGNW